MKSGKQRRSELQAKKTARKAKQAAEQAAANRAAREREAARGVPVDASALAPKNSYGAPDFVRRGYYLDKPFVCQGCGKDEVWTAAQQKWWYEVAKGYVYSEARLCRACRRRERERRAEARRVHQEGLARKRRANG